MRGHYAYAITLYSGEAMKALSDLYSQVITELGEDVNREGLLDTPKRAAKAMQFLTSGYETS